MQSGECTTACGGDAAACATGLTCDTAFGTCSYFDATAANGAACSTMAKTQVCICDNFTSTESLCDQPCTTRASGSDCPTGYACDPFFPSTIATIPDGIVANCVPTCTMDSDCSAFPGFVCLQSGGITGKTCQLPPATTGDAGVADAASGG